MDMQVETSERSLGPDDAPALTAWWLYGQVQTYASTTIYPKASRLERWSLWIGLAATPLGLLLAALPASLLPVIWAIKILIFTKPVDVCFWSKGETGEADQSKRC